ncbi:hexitol phosphatase HxpB [Corallincola spongiicola]|uniref:Hexitol phosphatase HxpB n=1 Tax=Corallincola spongiicola TaxID=2520508 RepID=A0ABY1WUL5_9GAMM|nr:hexitol phosphatase HxpB [Corallincola spongiicola]TAA48202.1 hexitol phosphatase HxpB [Corallincola spongiicola]
MTTNSASHQQSENYDAVIFDMDGVIVDSEPLWRAAEAQAFQSYGVPITEDMAYQTTGLRIDEVVSYWQQRFTFDTPSQVLQDAIMDRVITQIEQTAKPMAGVLPLMDRLSASGYPLAICSSSPMRLIDAVVQKFRIKDKFQALISAEHLALGKPHPQVYLKGAEALEVVATRCIAIEDSINGVIAAKAARMTTFAVPEPSQAPLVQFAIADAKFSSLVELNQAIEEWLPRLKA